uniref:Uncharacterized protein n=1 Tax=Myripristis murdjan TaxID=586833 RepID=A0A667XVB6_9TELE
MLSVREQRACQATSPPRGPDREDAEAELAELGACQCPGVAEACPCSQSAATSRKQLLQLRQEVLYILWILIFLTCSMSIFLNLSDVHMSFYIFTSLKY